MFDSSPAHTDVATDWRPLRDLEKLKSRTGCKGSRKVSLKSASHRQFTEVPEKPDKIGESPNSRRVHVSSTQISRDLSFEHAQKMGRD